jgi:hydrogenase expression/formation protein HypC
MCLAIPMKIVGRNGDFGVVEANGVKRSVFLNLVDAGIGDYVLIHAGIAIGKVDEKEAEETIAILKDIIKDETSDA